MFNNLSNEFQIAGGDTVQPAPALKNGDKLLKHVRGLLFSSDLKIFSSFHFILNFHLIHF